MNGNNVPFCLAGVSQCPSPFSLPSSGPNCPPPSACFPPAANPVCPSYLSLMCTSSNGTQVGGKGAKL